MRFAYPWMLTALALLPLMYWSYRRRRAAVRYPSLTVLGAVARSSRWGWLKHAGIGLRMFAVAALVLAAARPQADAAAGKRASEGLDIVLIVDTSRSMDARDFTMAGGRPTRLAVVKSVIADFIKARFSDRLGIVVFGTEAFTQAPLTLDHDVLLRFLDRVQTGMAGDDTAIGDGLATAVNRLRGIEAKSKVAILLTDGGNTAGRVDPLAAARAAAAKGVRVYTIGVGPQSQPAPGAAAPGQGYEVDEQLLREIARLTDGQYFHASDTETLVNVYATIDQLEKTRIDVQSFDERDERFGGYAALALGLMLAELGFGLTRFKQVP